MWVKKGVGLTEGNLREEGGFTEEEVFLVEAASSPRPSSSLTTTGSLENKGRRDRLKGGKGNAATLSLVREVWPAGEFRQKRS